MKIDTEKYNRSISLRCPTCGGDQFSHDNSSGELLTCGACHLEISKEDLMRANSENIDEHVKEIGKEITDDLARDLRESLKRAFNGNKHIRFK